MSGPSSHFFYYSVYNLLLSEASVTAILSKWLQEFKSLGNHWVSLGFLCVFSIGDLRELVSKILCVQSGKNYSNSVVWYSTDTLPNYRSRPGPRRSPETRLRATWCLPIWTYTQSLIFHRIMRAHTFNIWVTKRSMASLTYWTRQWTVLESLGSTAHSQRVATDKESSLASPSPWHFVDLSNSAKKPSILHQHMLIDRHMTSTMAARAGQRARRACMTHYRIIASSIIINAVSIETKCECCWALFRTQATCNENYSWLLTFIPS